MAGDAATGGYSGPDLGSVASRYSIEDILKSILDPSDSISEQYQASEIRLTDGNSLYGRVIFDTEKELAVATNPYDFNQLTKLPKNSIESLKPSQISLMPPGTVFGMNEDELKDLIAYFLSGGNRRHRVFR